MKGEGIMKVRGRKGGTEGKKRMKELLNVVSEKEIVDLI